MPINLIIRLTSEGVYATSPQAPGLAIGRKDIHELRDELQEILRFHFDVNDYFDVVEHLEQSFEIEDRELVIRRALDKYAEERLLVFERILDVARRPEQARSLVDRPSNVVGEIVYICALPADTIEWLCRQFDATDGSLTVAVGIAQDMILALPYNLTTGPEDSRLTLAEQGVTATTTFSDVMRRSPIVQPASQQLLTSH